MASFRELRMKLPKSIAGAIGRHWFRLVVRTPIPVTVSEVSIVSFPIPLVRSGANMIFRFRHTDTFERDIQFWGWAPWSGISAERLFAFGYAKSCGVSVGRLYRRPLSESGTVAAWIAFDENNDQVCAGVIGRDTRQRINDAFQTLENIDANSQAQL